MTQTQRSEKSKTSILEKAAAFIVDRRKAFYLIYIILIIFSIFSTGWVKVDNDLTDYLGDDTETRKGLDLMNEDFITYASANIMIDNVSFSDAERLRDIIEGTDGVKEVEFDDTTDHYSKGAALFGVTFSGTGDDKASEETLHKLEETLSSYDTYVSAEFGDMKANTVANEIKVVMVISCFIILTVLLLTSRTYMEIPVLVITFGVAAILNMGTNYFFGTISFISNSVAVILQLALAIDYAIILCHRYTEERETNGAREAVIAALSKAIPEIAGSCLTTLSGLAAMAFMDYKIGLDLSLVLIKAIAISIIVVFTLMPGLLVSFSPLIDKTHHRNFIPKITAWCNAVVKARYVTPFLFIIVVAAAFFLSGKCPYAYSYTNLTTIKKSDTQIADEMIKDTFSSSNILAIVVPSGHYDKEQALAADLEKYDEIDTITGLASVEATDGYDIGDMLTPRQFSELTDIDIELVRVLYGAYAADKEEYGRIVGGIDEYKISLAEIFDFIYDMSEDGYVSLDDDTKEDLDELKEKLDDGREQLESDTHSRLVLKLNISEESEETFEFLSTVRAEAEKYYDSDDVFLVGNSTSDYDLSCTFSRDNITISILSILFILIILFLTFQSAGLPIILILVIQGSIWINFSFPTIQNNPLFFLSYLVVSSIQMGANIDYAIVITNRYTELRKKMNKYDAIKDAMNLAFPTIFTSGLILASAGIIIGLMSSEPAIASIGTCLGRGTIISIILVMGILPQLLVLCDYIIEKTSFSLKDRLQNGGAENENK